MDILTFLDRRITEDEIRATLREWHAEGCSTVPAAGSDYTYPCDCGVPERLKAECAAKRAILAFDVNNQIWEPHGFSTDTTSDAFVIGSPKNPQARHVTRILAAAYADHPDYQQEWAVGG